MAKLYPPAIEGTIPAFCGTTLVVPFSLNRAISASEVYGIQVKIKTVSGSLKDTINSNKFDVMSKCYANFEIIPENYTVGQFYKVQIAFIDKDGVVGYYSTIGVVKYTATPVVSIEKMEFGRINSHNYYYTGVYNQKNGDTTEKLHSSRFRVFDGLGNIIDDTGYILHNSTKDIYSYETTEEYCLPRDLDENASFYIQFSVITINGLEVSSPRYRISQKRSVSTETKFDLVATLDKENGFIELTFENCESKLLSGTFLISRRSQLDGENIWTDFRRFSLHAIKPEEFSLLDCTIAHGIKYTYAIQQYNQNNLYSERVISNTVLADYEDAFLYDGEKQLRIRYNPKVSSFKTNHAEQKTETIGSQNPFIIRNGNVAYKEFPLSGLISYKMDEDNNMFMSMEELGIEQPSFNLTSENIAAERTFKMAVLDWLNNGKPKLFRSPAEGNFIVRLMNVTLSPQDSLGRMLHTFNGTACEVAPFTPNNLAKYSIIDSAESIQEQTQWASVPMQSLYAKYQQDPTLKRIQINEPQRLTYSVFFVDMMPGSIVYLDDESIMIGATGSYSASSDKGFMNIGIRAIDSANGICTYSYKARSVSMFGTISNLMVDDVPARQFIGNKDTGIADIYSLLNDIRTEVVSIGYVKFTKRQTDFLYTDVSVTDENFDVKQIKQENIFYDMDCSEPVESLYDLDALTTYQLRAKRGDYRGFFTEQYYVDRNTPLFSPYLDYYVDGYYAKEDGVLEIFPISTEMYDVKIDDNIINLDEIEKYELESPYSFQKIYINNGVIANIGYSTQIITYLFDSQDMNVKLTAKDYEISKNNYFKAVSDPEIAEQEVVKLKNAMKQRYNIYLAELKRAIDEYKEAYGIT